MADIFISYAREDQARAEQLASALEAKGWTVFWDRIIPPGKTWRGYIGAELNAARCVMVAWSRKSVESEWVLEEADEGKKREILVPVLFDKIELPLGFRSIQTADLSDWKSESDSLIFNQVTDAISDVISAHTEKISDSEQAAEKPELDKQQAEPVEQLDEETRGLPCEKAEIESKRDSLQTQTVFNDAQQKSHEPVSVVEGIHKKRIAYKSTILLVFGALVFLLAGGWYTWKQINEHSEPARTEMKGKKDEVQMDNQNDIPSNPCTDPDPPIDCLFR